MSKYQAACYMVYHVITDVHYPYEIVLGVWYFGQRAHTEYTHSFRFLCFDIVVFEWIFWHQVDTSLTVTWPQQTVIGQLKVTKHKPENVACISQALREKTSIFM